MSRVSLVVLGFAMTAFAHAATINVTTTSDQISDTGTCSLREAIIAANTNAPSGVTPGECASGSSGSIDTINVPTGTYALTLVGSESSGATNATIGDLDLTQRVTIIGAGRDTTIIDAAAADSRVMQLDAPTDGFEVSRLTVRNGATSGSGGGILVDNVASASFTDLRVDGNSAESDGGGIAILDSQSAVIFNRVLIENNEAAGDGGGIYFFSNALQISDARISGNQAFGFNGDGGGLWLWGGTVAISRITITENISANDGGGIYLEFGSLNVSSTAIDSNIAAESGGGVYLYNSDSSSMDNCTIADNQATDWGGGIVTVFGDNLTLAQLTIFGNSANSGSALDSGAVTLRNSIISGTCVGDAVVSQGGNIESPGDNCGLAHATDQVAVSASVLGLGALAFNGGATRSCMPSALSVALNTARLTYCTPQDQRGTLRPQGPACDVGAVERVAGWLFSGGFEEGDLSAWSSNVP